MRVGFDEQVFLAQRRGGISRYVVSLVESFRADPALGIQPVLGWSRTVNEHAIDAHLSRRPPRAAPQVIDLAACYVANRSSRRRARRSEVLHHTYYHPAFRARGFAGLRVTTIHDMTPELHPELFPNRNPHLAKADYVAASDLIICDSEATRRDLVAVYGQPSARTEVIPLGVDSRFRPGVHALPGMPDRYVLYVGSRAAYKDFDVLLDAFAGIPDPGLHLLAVGPAFDDREHRQIDRRRLSGRVRAAEALDHELPAAYAHAELLAFPSRHEGFGLPTLEAMASGIPVVLADASSHPEVGGDAARYFPAGDANALMTAMIELLNDADERARLGKLGAARAAAFPWARTAAATAAAYASALS